MINPKHAILIILLTAGCLCFWAASQFYAWKWISDELYFRLYAVGIFLWAIRQRIQRVSLADALVGNIVVWLCVFNLFDEVLSKTPAKPYKPYIMTVIVILSCILYTYYIKCRRLKKKDLKI